MDLLDLACTNNVKHHQILPGFSTCICLDRTQKNPKNCLQISTIGKTDNQFKYNQGRQQRDT